MVDSVGAAAAGGAYITNPDPTAAVTNATVIKRRTAMLPLGFEPR